MKSNHEPARAGFDRGVDPSVGWAAAVPTLLSVAAVVGIAYWCDRIYRRWLKENHPLAGYRTRVARMKSSYRARRAGVAEVAQLINEVFDEVARATSTGGKA